MSFLFHKKPSHGFSPASDVCKPEQRHQGLRASSCLPPSTPRFMQIPYKALITGRGLMPPPALLGQPRLPRRRPGPRLHGDTGPPRWELGGAGAPRSRRPAGRRLGPSGGLPPRTAPGGPGPLRPAGGLPRPGGSLCAPARARGAGVSASCEPQHFMSSKN